MTVDLCGAVGTAAHSHNCINSSSGATVSMGTPFMSTRVWDTLLYELIFFISGGVQHGRPAGPHSAVGRDNERSLSQNVRSRDAAHTSLMAVTKITRTGNRPTIQPIASAQSGYTYGPYEAGWYSTQLKNRMNYNDFVRLVGYLTIILIYTHEKSCWRYQLPHPRPKQHPATRTLSNHALYIVEETLRTIQPRNQNALTNSNQ